MFRFAVKRTDTGFPRLLMVETVFPMYRGLRKIIRSACVVVTVEKNGLRLYDDAFCVQIEPVSFAICVERFCPFLKYFKWVQQFRQFFTSPWAVLWLLRKTTEPFVINSFQYDIFVTWPPFFTFLLFVHICRVCVLFYRLFSHYLSTIQTKHYVNSMRLTQPLKGVPKIDVLNSAWDVIMFSLGRTAVWLGP